MRRTDSLRWLSHGYPTPARVEFTRFPRAALCGHGPSIPVLPNVGASRGGAATEPLEASNVNRNVESSIRVRLYSIDDTLYPVRNEVRARGHSARRPTTGPTAQYAENGRTPRRTALHSRRALSFRRQFFSVVFSDRVASGRRPRSRCGRTISSRRSCYGSRLVEELRSYK